MKTIGIIAFVAGLLLAVRVMFFGVQRKLGEDRVAFRKSPLALAAFLAVFGAMSYARAARAAAITGTWIGLSLVMSALAAFVAWWIVWHSESTPSTDPEDDPAYRFQGHVARVVEGIDSAPGKPPTGRIAFEFDGKRYEFRARWTTGDWQSELGRPDCEVVIERIDDDVALVEPWVAIEERL
ncbi:MAG TPA: hypothetical protein VKH19_01255 [Gemmatimonadaceae bacterium]|nr:hypothetical protein [Gemmatimonadaceae bacterium]